jgi:hypothetical protein
MQTHFVRPRKIRLNLHVSASMFDHVVWGALSPSHTGAGLRYLGMN